MNDCTERRFIAVFQLWIGTRAYRRNERYEATKDGTTGEFIWKREVVSARLIGAILQRPLNLCDRLQKQILEHKLRQKRFASGMIQASDNLLSNRLTRPSSGTKELHCTYTPLHTVVSVTSNSSFCRVFFRLWWTNAVHDGTRTSWYARRYHPQFLARRRRYWW